MIFSDLSKMLAQAPQGRLVTLDESAQLTMLLYRDAASGMTDQTIYVDAGCHAVA